MATISLELFTLRDFMPDQKGFIDTMKRVREVGYEAVEFAGVGAVEGEAPDTTAAEARRILDDAGLACASAHRRWGALRDDTDAEIEFLQTLGCPYVAVPIIIDEYDRYAYSGYQQFVADLPPVIEKLKAAGITLGHHNHSIEFLRGPDGDTIYDLLIEQGGPDLAMTVDVYWAAVAGVNPVNLIQRLHGRMPVIHMKDLEVVLPDDGHMPLPVFAPVGEGNLDWDAIIPAAKAAGAETWVVEQDLCRRDHYDCIRSSLECLKPLV